MAEEPRNSSGLATASGGAVAGADDGATAGARNASPANAGKPANRTAGVGRCCNCGYERRHRFCPKCGQNDRDYVRGLPPVLGDILKETFEVDSRFFRTLKPLFLRPGELPSEFSRNRRASYISPIRLYIFTSLVFFFLLATTTDFRPPPSAEPGGPREERMNVQIGAGTEGDRAAAIDLLKAKLPPWQQRKVDQIIARPGMHPSKLGVYGLASGASQYAASRQKDALADADTDSWHNELGRYLLARLIDVLDDPRAGFSLLLDNLPFAMFVTLPAYTLLLMVLYVRKRRYFTEHLVFAVQLHIFAFIILTALVALPDQEDDSPGRALARDAIVANMAGPDAEAQRSRERSEPDSPAATAPPSETPRDALPTDAIETPPDATVTRNDDDEEDGDMGFLGWLKTLLVLWVLVYHYLALRRFYGGGRVKTFFKWGILTVSYMLLLLPGLFLSAMLALTQI